MEKLQNKLSDNNLRELKQITLLIDEYCKPELIILFGKYADTTIRSVCGGYELLVISDSLQSEAEREELLDFIRLRYPPAERFEQGVFIHSFVSDFFLSRISRSVFFNVILTEGIELLNTRVLPLERFSLRKSVKKRHIDGVNTHAERCIYFAETFLKDAEAKKAAADFRICVIYLYHAFEMLLTALEYRHYGFRREYDHLSRHFQVARHASKELNDFYEEHKNEVLKMFKGLKKFRDDSLYCDSYGYPEETVYRYLEIVAEMKRIVTK